MTTPGLQRFSRSMVTRFKGTCAFCGTATTPGVDFAALSSGNWIAVCSPCSVSLPAQVRGKVRQMQDAVTAAGVDGPELEQITAVLPQRDLIAAAMADGALDTLAYDVLVKLDAAMVALTTVTRKADPLLDSLQAIAANGQASPRDRDFAGSLAAGLIKYGKLTDRQAPHADRLVARYATGTPVADASTPQAECGLYAHADGTVRKVYMTRNDRFACKVLIVHGENGAFEYEQGGRRTVSDALAAGTAHQMTQDEAAAFGRQHSFCCNCCIHLDDDRSLAAGYGPTCADNNGWFYPSYEQAAAILGRPVTKGKGKG